MTKSKEQSAAPPTAAELVAEFERQGEEQRTVDVLLSSRASERNNLLLSGSDADVIEHDRRAAALALRRDRASARKEAIRREHPVAAARELEASKIALRAEAGRQREAGTAAYLRAEAKLREVFDDLATVFAADAAIANANANAVAGAAPLLPCEADFRWVDGVSSKTESVPNEILGTAFRLIEGRSPVHPAALYDSLECPALRPGDAPLRVPSTPLGSRGHNVQKLQPAPTLPGDPAPAGAAPESAAPEVQPRRFHALPVFPADETKPAEYLGPKQITVRGVGRS